MKMNEKDQIALKILCAMISSPPEGINRHRVDKKLWANIAYDWADSFIEAKETTDEG